MLPDILIFMPAAAAVRLTWVIESPGQIGHFGLCFNGAALGIEHDYAALGHALIGTWKLAYNLVAVADNLAVEACRAKLRRDLRNILADIVGNRRVELCKLTLGILRLNVEIFERFFHNLRGDGSGYLTALDLTAVRSSIIIIIATFGSSAGAKQP